MLDETEAAQVLVRDIENYADARKNDVLRGATSARLATLMIQCYAAGQCHAVRTIYADPKTCERMWQMVESTCDSINPDWRADIQRRWAARPADLAFAK